MEISRGEVHAPVSLERGCGARPARMSLARMSASTVRATPGCEQAETAASQAALTLTPAVNKTKHLKDQPEHVGVKVGVQSRGCNGLSHTLEYARTKEILMKLVRRESGCSSERTHSEHF